MDELYRFQYSSISSCPDADSNFLGEGSNNNSIIHHHLVFTADQETHEVATVLEMPDLIKAQIANHPLYPNLLAAYIECRKVGAPQEMAILLEEISKENHHISTGSIDIGTDPELDDFMKSYCEVLHKYKEELSKPFDEATNFLSSIESQLTDLCKQTLPSTTYHPAEDGGGLSDEDMSCGEAEGASGRQEQRYCSVNSTQGGRELKEMLMRKYSGYLSTLRKEFLKKRKKGKLPKAARTALLDWWNSHYRWPYPTEEEKNRLSEVTELDQKQINNWFINQRKRHWKPSEDMRFALMEGVTGAVNEGSGPVYFDDATGGTGGIGT